MNLINGVGSINEERNVFLFEELNQGVDGADEMRDGNDVVEYGKFYFLWVAVHEVFNPHLEGFLCLKILSCEGKLLRC
jgi:hypothetical protein